MTEKEYLSITSRQRRLPSMIKATRHKLRALESEARRYGMHELLEDAWHVNQALEREYKTAAKRVGWS